VERSHPGPQQIEKVLTTATTAHDAKRGNNPIQETSMQTAMLAIAAAEAEVYNNNEVVAVAVTAAAAGAAGAATVAASATFTI
tara:strand:+ start:179 stop:427 length:249 start_codon:yes stop_codon:yes gene_type:complete